MSESVIVALGLSFLAGLSTTLGSLFVLLGRATSERTLAGALGFSAGVMVYVSFVELLSEARETLAGQLGASSGAAVAVIAFFGGIAVIALIDRLVPEVGNPHEMRQVHAEPDRQARLMRVSLLSAIAIAIHNFPEGLATFATAMHDPDVGVAVSVAVGIHNVPEGIAVSLPMLHATGSRGKAFAISSLSGLAEPVGAILGWLVLSSALGPFTMGVLLAGVAGVMVFISFDQLLPAAEEFGEHHVAVYGLVTGMAVMAGSLLLLEP